MAAWEGYPPVFTTLGKLGNNIVIRNVSVDKKIHYDFKRTQAE